MSKNLKILLWTAWQLTRDHCCSYSSWCNHFVSVRVKNGFKAKQKKRTVLVFSKFKSQPMQIWYCKVLCFFENFIFIFESSKPLPLWITSKCASLKAKLCSRPPRLIRFYCGQHGSWHETTLTLLPPGAITLFLCEQQKLLLGKAKKQCIGILACLKVSQCNNDIGRQYCFENCFLHFWKLIEEPIRANS